MKALVMSNEEPVRAFIARCFQHHGCDVAMANSRVAGLEIASDQACNIAVIDVSLCDGSGVDAIRLLRHKQPETFIIATSTRARWALSLELFEAGADDHLLKPFNRAQLCDHVQRAQAALST